MKRVVPAVVTILFGLLLVPAAAAEKPRPARFLHDLKSGKKVTIVTMGTSLTAGAGSWPDVMLKDWLDQQWPGQVTVFNEAVSGSASSAGPGDQSGLAVLPKVIAHQPDVVFIEFAINDAYLPYNISVANSQNNVGTMIEAILAARPKAEVILQTMNSIKDKPDIKHSSVRPELPAYYQGYRDVAKKRKLLLVDNFSNWLQIMNESPEVFDRLVPDGIHPAADGYRQVLLPQLQATLTGAKIKKKRGR